MSSNRFAGNCEACGKEVAIADRRGTAHKIEEKPSRVLVTWDDAIEDGAHWVLTCNLIKADELHLEPR